MFINVLHVIILKDSTYKEHNALNNVMIIDLLKIMFVLLANYLAEYVIILQLHVLHVGLIKHYLYGIIINAFQLHNVILVIFQTLSMVLVIFVELSVNSVHNILIVVLVLMDIIFLHSYAKLLVQIQLLVMMLQEHVMIVLVV